MHQWGLSSGLVGSQWCQVKLTGGIVTQLLSSNGLVGLLGSQVGLSSALVELSSGIVGSLGSQLMLPHGLVVSQRSQVIV